MFELSGKHREQELMKDKTRGRRNPDINNEEQKKNMKSSENKGIGRAGGMELRLMLPNNSMDPSCRAKYSTVNSMSRNARHAGHAEAVRRILRNWGRILDEP